MTPYEALTLARINGPSQEFEEAISKDYCCSLNYARDVIQGPFPLGEYAISKDYWCSLDYARNVIQGPFPLGEYAISKNFECSYYYAIRILKERFELGEPAIAKDAYFSYKYARNVLRGQFSLGEPEIATDGEYSYKYARYILKKPFPSGERSISKCIINNGRRDEPLGSPAAELIFNDKSQRLDYQFRFNRSICSEKQLAEHPSYALSHAIMIDGRFPKGEPAMKKSLRIWKRYLEFINESR